MAGDLRGCDVACKATWQSHASPRESLGGASVMRMCGRATRVHTDAGGGHMASEGAVISSKCGIN